MAVLSTYNKRRVGDILLIIYVALQVCIMSRNVFIPLLVIIWRVEHV